MNPPDKKNDSLTWVDKFYARKEEREMELKRDLEEALNILVSNTEITEYDMSVTYGFPYNARMEVIKHLSSIVVILREANGFFYHDMEKFSNKEKRTYRKILKSVSKLYKRMCRKAMTRK